MKEKRTLQQKGGATTAHRMCRISELVLFTGRALCLYPSLPWVRSRGSRTMSKNVLFVMVGLALATWPSLAQVSSGATLTGNVILNGRAASAAVIAVPYDAQTHETKADQAVVTPTDASGRFRLNVPDRNFLLVAWNGQDGVVLDSPADQVTLKLTPQGPPTYQVVADCAWRCSCRHIVGNLYWVLQWSNSIVCGSFQYLSWGCRC